MMCVTISTIPSFILVLAMEEEGEEEEEEKRNESHFITYCNTDQRQKEV
jgi:hypothetical protein